MQRLKSNADAAQMSNLKRFLEFEIEDNGRGAPTLEDFEKFILLWDRMLSTIYEKLPNRFLYIQFFKSFEKIDAFKNNIRKEHDESDDYSEKRTYEWLLQASLRRIERMRNLSNTKSRDSSRNNMLALPGFRKSKSPRGNSSGHSVRSGSSRRSKVWGGESKIKEILG